MRVPLSICIALALLLPALTWWLGTRKRDFVTPPPAQRLEEVRRTAEAKFAKTGEPANSPRPGPVAVIMPEDLAGEAQPDLYRKYAAQGAAYLIDLAKQLERNGHPQRALICWERVLDATPAKPEEQSAAAKAILRLRRSPEAALQPASGQVLTIRLHVGTDPATAKLVEPELKSLAALIENASGSFLRVEHELALGGQNAPAGSEAPVAFWISGAKADSPSSDLVSIPVRDAASAAKGLLRECHRIVRHQLTRQGQLQPPAAWDGTGPAADGLQSTITRLTWTHFARLLNP